MRPSGSTDRPAAGGSRARRLAPLGAALWLVVSMGACRELATVADVAFPSAVPGLPSDQPWTSLPVRRWLTEPGIEPVAISACFAPACPSPAAVMLFRAQGPEAVRLARAAADPAALVASLERGPRAPPDRHGRRPPRSVVKAEPAGESGMTGYAVRIARPDGRRSAAGYVLAAERDGTTTALVIVAATPEAARQLARAVAPHLGG